MLQCASFLVLSILNPHQLVVVQYQMCLNPGHMLWHYSTMGGNRNGNFIQYG